VVVADLLTHSLVPFIVDSEWLDDDELAAFVQGGILPDILARSPVSAVGLLAELGIVSPVVGDDRFILGLEFLHEPIGFALLSLALVLLAPASLLGLPRRAAWAWLLLGALSHSALDVIQRHPEAPYMWLFPCSSQTWELGLVGTEASMLAWPVLIPVAVALARRRAARLRVPAARR
jgi:membrane-bound metal-dependent hydrolase YbcI (DUF457 family)